MSDARRLTQELDRTPLERVEEAESRSPFGLYCLIALAAGVAAGVILIDMVTRPQTDSPVVREDATR